MNIRRWAIIVESAAAMADYIDNFNNAERRHSYLGNITPTEFETLWTSTYSIPQLARPRLETARTDHVDQFRGSGHIHFDTVIGWIPKSAVICSIVTPSSRLRAARTTSSRNSLG